MSSLCSAMILHKPVEILLKFRIASARNGFPYARSIAYLADLAILDAVSGVCAAALASSWSGDKVRANAVRAMGYLVAAGPDNFSAGENTSLLARQPDVCQRCMPDDASSVSDRHCTMQQRPSAASTSHAHSSAPREHRTHSCSCDTDMASQRADVAGSTCQTPPGWFARGLCCLGEALANGNGKVQWNTCYAIGALLRNARSVAAANACGSLQPLLSKLLSVLQHSASFKACAPRSLQSLIICLNPYLNLCNGVAPCRQGGWTCKC